RIVGLYAMALIALLSVLVNLKHIMAIRQLQLLALFISAIVGGFTVFFAFGFSRRIRSHRVTHAFFKKIPAGRSLERLYDSIHSFRRGKRQFLLGIALSLFIQSANILALYILARFLNYPNLTLASFFFVIPIGLIATAIPISPAGIGVGQAVFLALFTWYQGTESNLGPTLITISQVS